MTPILKISLPQLKMFVAFQRFAVMGYLLEGIFSFEWGREMSLGKPRPSCERHGLYLLGAFRSLGSGAHLYIRCIYLYIIYLYKIFSRVWVCSLSNTTEQDLPTVSAVTSSTVVRRLTGDLASFLSLHSILMKATEPWLGQLLENGSHVRIRASHQWEAVWGCKKVLELAAWTWVPC